MPGGFAEQAARVCENLTAGLAASGCTFQDVVRATVYLQDLGDFAELNGFYAKAMGDHRPARSTVEVAGLPKGAMLEIDLVARIP